MRSIEMPEDYADAYGAINRKDPVSFKCEAYAGQKLAYIRSLRFEGAGFNVFNFVALPSVCYDLAILGIDLVSLPGTFKVVMFFFYEKA